MKKVLIQVSLAAALAASNTVATAFDRQYETFEVSLSFSRSQPVSEVYEAIRQKARRECQPRSVIVHYFSETVRECRRGVAENFVSAIQWPELSALHDSQAANNRIAQKQR